MTLFDNMNINKKGGKIIEEMELGIMLGGNGLVKGREIYNYFCFTIAMRKLLIEGGI